MHMHVPSCFSFFRRLDHQLRASSRKCQALAGNTAPPDSIRQLHRCSQGHNFKAMTQTFEAKTKTCPLHPQNQDQASSIIILVEYTNCIVSSQEQVE